MKLPSRKRNEWFSDLVQELVQRYTEHQTWYRENQLFIPTAPHTSYENSGKPRHRLHFSAWKNINSEKISGLSGENDHAKKEDSNSITNPYKL